MEKKKIKAEETLWEAKKKSIIAGSVIVVLLVLGMIGGILYKVYAGQGTVGGMLVGTIALLFVVPTLFIIFQSIEERVSPNKLKKSQLTEIE